MLPIVQTGLCSLVTDNQVDGILCLLDHGVQHSDAVDIWQYLLRSKVFKVFVFWRLTQFLNVLVQLCNVLDLQFVLEVSYQNVQKTVHFMNRHGALFLDLSDVLADLRADDVHVVQRWICLLRTMREKRRNVYRREMRTLKSTWVKKLVYVQYLSLGPLIGLRD